MLAFLRSPLHPPADVSGWRPYQIATGGKKQILRGGENCGASAQIRRLAAAGRGRCRATGEHQFGQCTPYLSGVFIT